jgi:hypothetical protein
MKRFALLLLFFSAAVAQADLKSWLHGSPPAPSPGPPDAKAAVVSFAPNVADDKQILDFLKAFAEAMRVHDGNSLKPMLADSYEIEGLPDENKPVDFFMQAMVVVKAPDEIVVTAIEHDGEKRVAKLEFRSTERGTKQRSFKFDANGKLLSADFFTLKRQ